VALVIAAGSAAAAQDSAAARWELAAELRGGVPTGWVQVRENAIAGTRLSFGPSLEVHALWAAELRGEFHPDARTRIALSLTSFTLDGSVTLPQNVDFNGATLEGGTTLATRTSFPHWLALTLTGTRDVAHPGAGAIGVTAGLSFVALTFVLEGTLAPASATRETQEDFVTQELPVPLLGAEYRAPIGERWRVEARVTGGWLPWVNSLRQEGGTVTITQTELQLAGLVRYAAARSLDVTGEVRFSTFAQDEQSTEDGNQISMRALTLGVGAAWRF